MSKNCGHNGIGIYEHSDII